MTTPIVIQLQELAIDSNSDIEELLKKTLLIATKLNISELREWCKKELDGHFKTIELPNYRKLKGKLFVFDPSQGNIPFFLPSDIDELVTEIDFRQSVSDLRNLLKSGANEFERPLSQNVVQTLIDMQADNLTQFMPKLIIYRTQFMGIVSIIKNIIFDWSLKLEEQGILGEGIQFSQKEKQAAMAINNYHIGNMQGVVGNVTGGTINQQNQMTVQTANFDSLAKNLSERGISHSDLVDLQAAIDADPQPTEVGKFGDRVSAWIGTMVGKAATGSWDISIGVAGTLLAEAISKFYGLG